MIINPYLVQPSIPPFTGILDTYTGAAAAYSAARRLSSTYTGSLIRVRRSSDNAEQDIGYDGSNVLDEAALTSFVGSGNNGFVTTWYDQSGNANNAVQSTAANQPQIVSSGSIVKRGGKPALDFDGSNDRFTRNSKILNNTGFSAFTVLELDSTSTRVAAWDIAGGGSNQYVVLDINTFGTAGQRFGYYVVDTSFDSTASTNLNQNLVSIHATTTALTSTTANTSYFVNNSSSPITNITGNNLYRDFSGITNFSIGSFTNGSLPFAGEMQEIIFYPTNRIGDNTGINTNINTFYSIY
jgi:hypothetical protein